MQNSISRYAIGLQRERAHCIARMARKEVVPERIIKLVELDTVDVGRVAVRREWRVALLGFTQSKVELDRVLDLWIHAHDRQRFAVDVLGVCHRPEFAAELDRRAPQ